MVHGGWPFTREITPLLEKPNAYLDFSAQSLLLSPATLSGILREWLEHVQIGTRRLAVPQGDYAAARKAQRVSRFLGAIAPAFARHAFRHSPRVAGARPRERHVCRPCLP